MGAIPLLFTDADQIKNYLYVLFIPWLFHPRPLRGALRHAQGGRALHHRAGRALLAARHAGHAHRGDRPGGPHQPKEAQGDRRRADAPALPGRRAGEEVPRARAAGFRAVDDCGRGAGGPRLRPPRRHRAHPRGRVPCRDPEPARRAEAHRGHGGPGGRGRAPRGALRAGARVPGAHHGVRPAAPDDVRHRGRPDAARAEQHGEARARGRVLPLRRRAPTRSRPSAPSAVG